MVDLIEFPSTLKITDRSDPMLVFNTRSGGVAIDGGEQVLSALSSRWEWRPTVAVRSKAEARALRKVRSMLRGRFNYLLMRVCDRYRLSGKEIGFTAGSMTYSDGATHSDGSEFASPQPSAIIVAAAAAGAETISILKLNVSNIMTAGVFFSINGWLYQVENWEEDGANFILSIAPPLREAVEEDDVADFDASAIWVFASDDTGDIDLRIGRYGSVQLNLVEPVGRRLYAP